MYQTFKTPDPSEIIGYIETVTTISDYNRCIHYFAIFLEDTFEAFRKNHLDVVMAYDNISLVTTAIFQQFIQERERGNNRAAYQLLTGIRHLGDTAAQMTSVGWEQHELSWQQWLQMALLRDYLINMVIQLFDPDGDNNWTSISIMISYTNDMLRKGELFVHKYHQKFAYGKGLRLAYQSINQGMDPIELSDEARAEKITHAWAMGTNKEPATLVAGFVGDQITFWVIEKEISPELTQLIDTIINQTPNLFKNTDRMMQNWSTLLESDPERAERIKAIFSS